MPTTGKSAKEQNELKWRRMKIIIDQLKTPKSSAELEKLAFNTVGNRNNKRVLHIYLLELKGIDIITYDDNKHLYSLAANKLVFESKAEYELAGEHAYNIFYHKIGEGTDYEGEDSYFWSEKVLLRLLAFYEGDKKREQRSSHMGADSDNHYAHVYLLQHIRTGYPEIFELIDKYKQFLVKHGITSGYTIYRSDNLIEHIPEQPKIDGLTDSEKQEVTDMVDLFVGKFVRMRRDAKERQPLLGRCDGCPTPRVTIKGDQEL